MHYKILSKFIGKKVEVFSNGASHTGILLYIEDSVETLLLRYDDKDFRAKLYGDLYVNSASIDAIHEFIEPAVIVAQLGEEPTHYQATGANAQIQGRQFVDMTLNGDLSGTYSPINVLKMQGRSI